MTRKEMALAQVTRDVSKYGHVTLETEALFKDIACSEQVYTKAIYQGKKIRNSIYDKHRVFQLSEIDFKHRDGIRRHLSCGGRLDTPEAKILIDNFHTAKDTYLKALHDAEEEFLAL